MRGWTPLALIVLAACGGPGRPEGPLDDFGTVADFTLIDQNGEAFGTEQLRGNVWVVDFFFTRCPSVCPRVTAAMTHLVNRSPQRDDLRFVSVTVDCEHDQPEVLLAHAQAHNLPLDRWSLLTGNRSVLRQLSLDSFKLALGEEMNAKGDITHSVKQVVVDRDGTIRGYFDSLDPERRPHIDGLLKRLLETQP
ncbi:MAG: SCO family protein [Planctomycetes bacterium]|nr:SCO family protein [Planctomycetota bacterium]